MDEVSAQKTAKNAAIQSNVVDGDRIEVFFHSSFFGVTDTHHATDENKDTKGFQVKSKNGWKRNVDVGNHVAKAIKNQKIVDSIHLIEIDNWGVLSYILGTNWKLFMRFK